MTSLANQWEDWDKRSSYDMKGMILGTEEFDRVGEVPYSNLDGILLLNIALFTKEYNNDYNFIRP